MNLCCAMFGTASRFLMPDKGFVLYTMQAECIQKAETLLVSENEVRIFVKTGRFKKSVLLSRSEVVKRNRSFKKTFSWKYELQHRKVSVFRLLPSQIFLTVESKMPYAHTSKIHNSEAKWKRTNSTKDNTPNELLSETGVAQKPKQNRASKGTSQDL